MENHFSFDGRTQKDIVRLWFALDGSLSVWFCSYFTVYSVQVTRVAMFAVHVAICMCPWHGYFIIFQDWDVFFLSSWFFSGVHVALSLLLWRFQGLHLVFFAPV